MQVSEAAWREFRARLLAFVARRVTDGHAAEDIVQEIMLRIHRHAGSVERTGAMNGWVYQIARNAVIDYYRGAAARRELPAGVAPGDDPPVLGHRAGGGPQVPAGRADGDQRGPGAGADGDPRAELADCLRPLLAGLPPAYREAIMLTEFDGMTQAAAAERLGLTVSGMKSRVQRGRAMLRQQLTDCCRIEQDRRGAIIGYRPESGSGSCDCRATS